MTFMLINLHDETDGATDQPKPEWPMLTKWHLEALIFAYNEGYSKAYENRVYPNPFTTVGSQAEAWTCGTRDGNEARVNSK
jgi:hypothetical protein